MRDNLVETQNLQEVDSNMYTRHIIETLYRVLFVRDRLLDGVLVALVPLDLVVEDGHLLLVDSQINCHHTCHNNEQITEIFTQV
jgi:hypothetical protein